MTLSYQDLDRWAAAVARVLRARGVDREIVVGVFLPRSARLVAGALGIMKAGGAYLPLDPDYPADRVAFMLEDAGCPVVLTTQDLAGRLPEGPWQAMVLTSIARRRTTWPTSSTLRAPQEGQRASRSLIEGS
jgi:microcystin synthetase protein McyC